MVCLFSTKCFCFSYNRGYGPEKLANETAASVIGNRRECKTHISWHGKNLMICKGFTYTPLAYFQSKGQKIDGGSHKMYSHFFFQLMKQKF